MAFIKLAYFQANIIITRAFLAPSRRRQWFVLVATGDGMPIERKRCSRPALGMLNWHSCLFGGDLPRQRNEGTGQWRGPNQDAWLAAGATLMQEQHGEENLATWTRGHIELTALWDGIFSQPASQPEAADAGGALEQERGHAAFKEKWSVWEGR